MAVLGVGVGLLGVATNLLLSTRLSADASSVLRDRAGAEQATLAVRGGRIAVREAPNDAVLDRSSWVFARGETIERAPASAEVQRAALALAGVARPTERTVANRVRLRAEPVAGPGGRPRAGVVVVAISLQPYEDTERIALLGTLALAGFVLAAGALVTRRAVGTALRPVADMTAMAADWSERDLHRRFDLGPPRDELTGLAATLDSQLARIDAALRHEQRFSSEMAHELRTPLAGVRGEAELALRPGGSRAEHDEALRRILAGTDRMATAIDTLLAAARRDASGAPGSCDPVEAVDTALAATGSSAKARGVRLVLHAPSHAMRAGADKDLVTQALHPLLDNAIRHAAATVVVAVTERDGEAILAVADDGQGLDPDRASDVFEPGASWSGGAGLGLPLARRLARSCGGDVEAQPRGNGGRFELRLPATAVHLVPDPTKHPVL